MTLHFQEISVVSCNGCFFAVTFTSCSSFMLAVLSVDCYLGLRRDVSAGSMRNACTVSVVVWLLAGTLNCIIPYVRVQQLVKFDCVCLCVRACVCAHGCVCIVTHSILHSTHSSHCSHSPHSSNTTMLQTAKYFLSNVECNTTEVVRVVTPSTDPYVSQ